MQKSKQGGGAVEAKPLSFFGRRAVVKHAKHLIRHARHVRNMREDIAQPVQLERLSLRVNELSLAIKQGAFRAVQSSSDALTACLCDIMPPRHDATIREYVEIVIVAVAVAMGVRTYFLQPFKIPTGSMQPTLFGIHSVVAKTPGMSDNMLPLKLAKAAIYGEWYKEVRVRDPGTLVLQERDTRKSYYLFSVAGRSYEVPRDAVDRGEMNYRTMDAVPAGGLLWSGYTTVGDHVFVNKVAWNFGRPERGQVMVFSVAGIPGMTAGDHYIKRMVGLPGESISIEPPYLRIGGVAVMDPFGIRRVSCDTNGYAGYQLCAPSTRGYLMTPFDVFRLQTNQYFGCGDNTMSSYDSRYWGAVPRDNLVGPAFCVYWPFSGRWGKIQ